MNTTAQTAATACPSPAIFDVLGYKLLMEDWRHGFRSSD
jgi:hypothetical protein